jgi:hypothetical protein
MINNSLGPLFSKFDHLQNEISNTLENVLEEHSNDIAILVRQAKSNVEKTIPEVLEVITTHLEESRDESAKFIDKKITEPFQELEKMKGDISQDIAKFKVNLQKEALKQDEIAKATIAETLLRADERFEIGKIEIKDIINLVRIDTEDIIKSLIKNILNENSNKIEQSTTIMEEAGTKLVNTLGNTIYLLEDSGKTFEGIVNMSDKVMPIDELELGILYGNESIVRSMKDMLLRAKEEIILITPEVITDFLYEIEKQPQITNYQIVSKITEEDIGLLTQLIKRGNVITKNYKGQDYWIAIRDNEELLFAPKIHNEKNIAFVTTNPKLYKLFYDIVERKVFAEMKAQDFAQ